MSAKAHLSPVWLRIFELEVAHGEGVYLYATDGRRYLDFTSGIGVTNTGHCHPKVVAAIQEQAARLLHGQINIVIHRPVLELVEELLTIVPAPLDTFFFANSGAEAVEAAVKLARYATGRPNIIVFQGSFHGRTHMAMALTTSKTIYRAGYQPLPAGVYVAPYPYAYRYGWDEETTLRFCLRELDLLLKSQTAPEETAAILVEPILGEGGYVVPPRGFLTALRERCDHYGILLIADEVQTGFGRTGRFFAVEHEGVAPDTLTDAVWTPRLETARALWRAFFEAPERFVRPVPLVRGEDLLAMGVPEGPQIGRILEAIREAQAAGEITTREEALALARRLIDEAGAPEPRR